MKRCIEETVEAVNTTEEYPHPSSPRHPSGTVNQSAYTSTIKSTSELQNDQAFSIFTSIMPANTPSKKPVVAGGSQGTSINLMQTEPPIQHNVHDSSVTLPVSSSITTAQQQQQIQRLKVEDAASYIDMVRFKFADQPQIFNNFLNIMKEFKSQGIDTSGVIDGVLNLFNGHPELITGFNIFLPPDYKIKAKASEQGYSTQVKASMYSPSSGTTTSIAAASAIQHSTQEIIHLATKPLPNTVIVTHGRSGSTVVASPNTPLTLPPHFPANHTSSITSEALSHVDNSPQSQPVKTNHAINYVNKIKNRFQGQPDKYRRFLEILQTYQKEQHTLSKNEKGSDQSASTKQLTETEVYSQVATLFQHQQDLLAEFGQFLPDAAKLAQCCEEPTASLNRKPILNVKMSTSSFCNTTAIPETPSSGLALTSSTPHMEPVTFQALKRSSSITLHNPSPSSFNLPASAKKPKLTSEFIDFTIADTGKDGTLADYAFFDKVHKALGSQEVYDNFLRCIHLFTREIVSRAELVQIITPFLGNFPELFHWFKGYTGHADHPKHISQDVNLPPHNSNLSSDDENIYHPGGEKSDIDFSSCKRLGASYCALPENHPLEKCSGRTEMCIDVLNDTWVSFPAWSEGSTFATSRKTKYEEDMHRCEDERFELDIIIEINAATIRVLEGVSKRLLSLSHEEAANLTLDDCLGGRSPTIHKTALMRIYGDKGHDIINLLMKVPAAAVPVVLRRLKTKDKEWREAQRGFNKIWNEQNEKNYLKSLDNQGINFKQNDMKFLRSKSLYSEIESCFDERNEQTESGDPQIQGPHMTLQFKDKSVLNDAADLLIHYVKRQTSIQKEDKQRIVNTLHQLLTDFFHHSRQELIGDECETGDEGARENKKEENAHKLTHEETNKEKQNSKESSLPAVDRPHDVTEDDESYTLFFGNSNWYLFFRLHHILCERLYHILKHAKTLSNEEKINKEHRSEATSESLRLKPKIEYLKDVEVDNYYSAFLDLVKNVLDGNVDTIEYEDTLREMFGIHAYRVFTLDKVVTYAVRQLEQLVVNESSTQCLGLYLEELSRGGAGGLCATAHSRRNAEAAYQRKAKLALAEENCFKIFIYKLDCKLTVELLYYKGEDNETTPQEFESRSLCVDDRKLPEQEGSPLEGQAV